MGHLNKGIALFFLSLILISCDTGINRPSTEDETKSKTEQQGKFTPLLSSKNLSIKQLSLARNVVAGKFKEENGEKWRVSWVKKAKTPISISGGSTQTYNGSPEDVARTFLKSNRSLFNMSRDLSDLQLKEVITSTRGVRHVRFQQEYKGIPVYNGTYQVHVNPDGSINMANGHYYHNIEVPTSPSISGNSAFKSVINDIEGNPSIEWKKKPSLYIYKNQERDDFTLAWKIELGTKAPNRDEWKYLVNAETGDVLRKISLTTSFRGIGNVYEDNPTDTPNYAYRYLKRLDGDGSILEGRYANVHNASGSRATSPTGEYEFEASNIHFDEVNVYYHVDTFRADYINALGFYGKDIGSDEDMEAYVNDPGGTATYYGGSESIRFGNTAPWAKTDLVIYHEFTHAIVDAENGGYVFDSDNSEEGAIGEGLSDYFAGSFTNEAETGTYILSNPRNMNNPYYSDYSALPRNSSGDVIAGEHLGGEFFSAILWDLRQDIGEGITDEIVFAAISRVSSFPNFLEYRDAMIAADNTINSGVNANVIQDAFAGRGVGSYSPLTVNISGPASLNPYENGTFTANVSDGSGSYSYTWSRAPRNTLNYQVVSNNQSYTGSSAGQDFSLRLEVTDSEGRSGSGYKSVIVGTFDKPQPCPGGEAICP